MLFSLSSSATVYEDAEDKQTFRWEKLDRVSKSEVNNLLDREKKSRVLKFKGEGTKSSYVLKVKEVSKKTSKREYLLSWEMQYHEDFVIIVTVVTTMGKRQLIYTPGIFQSNMLFGLGLSSTNGEWRRYERNLQKDLDYYDNRCTILSLSSFVIRGSGYIDNIKTKVANVSKKVVINREVSLFPRKVVIRKHKKNSLPTIKIEGENPLHLEVGESFIEPGVKGYDKEDGELVVVSMESIDSREEGMYSVMYMVRDKEGDSAICIRHIIVGDISNVKEEVETPEILEKEKQEEKQLKMDEREYEIEAWERELGLREKALKKKLHLQKDFLRK